MIPRSTLWMCLPPLCRCTEPENINMMKRAQKWVGCMDNLKLLGETQPGPKCLEHVYAISDTKKEQARRGKKSAYKELVELTQVHPLFQHL
jgi:hypothetical protein